MVKSPQDCKAGERTVFVRNIAARGLMREFIIHCDDLGGDVEIRHGFLPFFWAATTEHLPLTPGMAVKRGFFDASFELAITPNRSGNIRVE